MYLVVVRKFNLVHKILKLLLWDLPTSLFSDRTRNSHNCCMTKTKERKSNIRLSKLWQLVSCNWSAISKLVLKKVLSLWTFLKCSALIKFKTGFKWSLLMTTFLETFPTPFSVGPVHFQRVQDHILCSSTRCSGCPLLRYKDTLNKNLKFCKIDTNNWHTLA